MVSQALQAIRRVVTVDWPKNAEQRARSHLVAVAKAGHATIMAEQTARGGSPPEFDAYADTPGNRNLESVKAVIVYRYRYLRELVAVALQELRAASPVVSGLYRDSHTLFINGLPVTGAPPNLRAGDE